MVASIIADSACDVGKSLIDDENCTIEHVPLNMQIGETVFVDDENLNLDDYINQMEASATAVKTSAPAPGLFFERFKAASEHIFAVTLSSKLSATYQSAMAAKDMYLEECGKKFIHVFDSLTASVGEGIIALKIAELIKAGEGALEIVDKVNQFMSGMRTYIVLDKFDNLVKTGRIKPYVAKIASFLNVKPICADEDGEIKMLDKARGFAKATAKLVNIIKESTPDIENRVIAITHVKALDKALALKEEFMATMRPKDIVITECRGITTTYAARGGIVVAV